MGKGDKFGKFSAKIIAETEAWVSENGLQEYGGATLKAFCEHFGISNRTFYRWKDGQASFVEALKRGRERFKDNSKQALAVSLSMAAKGYEREEVETEYKPNPADPSSPVIVRMKRKKVYHAPNVAAAIFLLCNLDPEHYQNRRRADVDMKAAVNGGLTFARLLMETGCEEE